MEPRKSNTLDIVKGKHKLLVAGEAGVELDGVHNHHLGGLERDRHLQVQLKKKIGQKWKEWKWNMWKWKNMETEEKKKIDRDHRERKRR